MKKDAGVLYRSFVEGIQMLPDDIQLEMYRAYASYVLDGEEYDGDNAVVKGILHMMKPSLDKAQRNYETKVENGSKGGAPVGNQNAKKTTKKQPKTTEKQPKTTLKEEVEEEVEVNTKEKSAKADQKKRFPEDEKLDKAFSDFVAMRKQIKKPMTLRAEELAIKKLNTLSGGDNDLAIAILEQSILNSWQGLFALQQPRPRSGTDWDALMRDAEAREATT